MHSKMAATLLLGLPLAVLGGNCQAGQKMKGTLTGLYCSGSATTASTCGGCCKNDPLKCGGGLAIGCTSDHYKFDDEGDTWKNKATTASTKNTDCCKAVATCASTYTCAAGYKKKSGVESTKCTGRAATCVSSTCCEVDPLKCGGSGTISCPTDKYQDADEAWKNTATTADKKTTDCCKAKATCASTYTCAAGYKKKSGVESTKCTGGAATCAISTCCEADPLKCGGLGTISCPTDKYQDADEAWKNTATTAAAKTTDCCKAKATCASTYNCAAGYKKKSGVESTKCTGGAATCASSTCCEVDPLKCGGLGTISCPTGKYKDADEAWKNTATTAATKNTDCCKAKATCSAFSSSSTSTDGVQLSQSAALAFGTLIASLAASLT